MLISGKGTPLFCARKDQNLLIMKTTRVEPLPVQFGESTTPRMQTLTMEVEAFPMQFEESLPRRGNPQEDRSR
jgi:hypothetical protein